tara:strand:+ start:44 stop:1678 length:1635 start_codon:yes stop_codon:yes gene_type:complete
MKILKNKVSRAIETVLKSLEYPIMEYSLAPSKNPEFGDISSNVALILSRELKEPPIKIAKKITSQINEKKIKYVSSITVTNPGFINFFINASFFQKNIQKIWEHKEKYGSGDKGKGKTANVEFVSANPTGPLTVGHGRNAILGDTIANILKWNGYEVTREYYYNNAGRQMQILAKSVEARYYQICGKEHIFPDDGYQGEYIKNIAQNIINQEGSNLKPGSNIFIEIAEKEIFSDIKESLKKIGINFDYFANEKSFFDNGMIDKLIKELKEKNLIYEKDGATWFKATKLGKTKDKVYIKSSGEPTYRVPDTAYHRDKLKRKYDLIVDIFGADHADSYPDVLLALSALGLNIKPIKVLLYQFVTLLRNGKKVKMSTRKANFVTLDELINELGPDVVRYFFIMRSMNSHLDFDLDLATDQSEKNPVFYLQYAHARICNILRYSKEGGYDKIKIFHEKLLTHPDELSLMKHMAYFPELNELALVTLEPQLIVNYLQELASRFHRFYGQCRVITKDKELSKARLGLIKAVKIILNNGMNILGLSAPTKM